MDHLLMPNEPAHPSMRIEYLSNCSYDAPFNSFPSRRGWADGKLFQRDENASKAQLKELAGFLQTWLFFGVLQEVSKQPITLKQWIVPPLQGTRATRLSTACLRSHVKSVHQMLDSMDATARDSHYQHIGDCIGIAASVLNRLSLGDCPIVETNEVLAIGVLCDLLDKEFGSNVNAYRASGRLHIGLSRQLQVRMLQDGWCPNDVHRLAHQLDLSSLYYASNLDRPEPDVRHDACTDASCSKSQLQESSYKTRHALSCDENCRMIDGPPEELSSMLLTSNVIPLIHYDPANVLSPFKLVPCTAGVNYVAISHVWSHGLGNPYENALWECQLHRIARQVSQLYPERSEQPALYWLDTICFPLHDSAAADKAMLSMRKTYDDADCVLVLDRYLESSSSKDRLSTECLMRVLCSSWTRRLWTLQEGVLAKKLYFQFADKPIEISNAAFTMTMEMTFVIGHRSLEYQPITSMISELWEVWRERELATPQDFLNYLAGGLRWRATSVSTDEALCLAALANLDMAKLLEASPEDRMMRFWSLSPIVSAQAAFWSGAKMQRKGFRWAPTTFLGQPEAILQDLNIKLPSENPGSLDTTCTDAGLQFKCAGLMLNSWRSNIGNRHPIYIRNKDQSWYQIVRQEMNRDSVVVPRSNGPGVDEIPHALVLIMKTTLANAFSEPRSEPSVTCVLASVYDVDEANDIVYANTEEVVFLVPLGNSRWVAETLPLVVKVVTTAEKLLGLVPTCDLLESSDTGASEGRHRLSDVQGLPAAIETSANHKSSTYVSDFYSTAGEDTVQDSEKRVQDQEVVLSRVKCRDEDGRLSADLDGDHYIFDVVELSAEQKWCLD